MSRIDSIINTAKTYIGTKEGSNNHREIIDLYNKARYNDAYQMTTNDPWCCAFVVAVFEQCGMSDIIPCYAACDQMINIFTKWGRYYSRSVRSVRPGDIIFYDWNGDLSSDHVGIVIQNRFGELSVIEGNKSDSVEYRNISISSPQILGFGVPNYEAESGSDSTSTQKYRSYFSEMKELDKRTIMSFPLLLSTSKGLYVTILQLFLAYYGKYPMLIGCDFDSVTERYVREWQKSHDLEVDGVVGKETWSSFFIK